MRAGCGRADIAPPLGLPMLGFVRSQAGATCHGLPLEVTTMVLEEGATRVVLCGIDTLGIAAPAVDELRARVAEATGAAPAGVLLNWNHTHRAPPAGRSLLAASGLLATDGDERLDAYESSLCESVVAATEQAAARLEPAGVAWGVGEIDVSVNRRESAPDGTIVHGWRLGGLLDRQVVSLQARRPDDTVIGTLVGFGCHTVSVGMDFPGYSSDFPGAMRPLVRQITGGECVYFQGAAANVLPQVSFVENEEEAHRIGLRLAIEALHSVAERTAWPRRLVRSFDGSLIPMLLLRFETAGDAHVPLKAVERSVSFPMQPFPSENELEQIAGEYGRAAERAAGGAGDAELYGLLYHAKWAERTLARLRGAPVAQTIDGPVHAVRVGDGVIVTGPGEVFTEIGMAVKERSPGRPTLYAGYTNGAIGYFPTSSAYPEGGYEPVIANRSYGTPAPMAPACERLLVETGVRLAESLFPAAAPFGGESWAATGDLPTLAREWIQRPPDQEFVGPVTADYEGQRGESRG
jgi:hypothetical protein